MRSYFSLTAATERCCRRLVPTNILRAAVFSSSVIKKAWGKLFPYGDVLSEHCRRISIGFGKWGGSSRLLSLVELTVQSRSNICLKKNLK